MISLAASADVAAPAAVVVHTHTHAHSSTFFKCIIICCEMWWGRGSKVAATACKFNALHF